MKKFLLLVFALILLCFPVSVFAIGSYATGTYVDVDREEGKKLLTISWKGDSVTGAVPSYSIAITGFVYLAVTNPGAVAPDANYGITLTVDGVDIMGGVLLLRSATATEQVVPKIGPVYGTRYVHGTVVFALTGNTVPSAIGTLQVYVDRK